jgi:pimeloyl-[acyl-carrier protein] methyl ester esterase
MKNVNLNNSQNAIVFLPGWGFKASIWDELIQVLKLTNAYTIDLPDEEKIHVITETLNQHIPEQTTLVGWSLGGLIAIYFCYRFPEKCKKLILVCCSPQFVASENWAGITKDTAIQFQKNAQENMEVLLKNFLGIVQYPNNDRTLRLFLKKHLLPSCPSQNSLTNYLNLLLTADFRSYFQKLCMPILAIYSEQDAIVPVITGEQLTRMAPTVSIKIIPKAGHIPFLTHQESFLDCIKMDLLAC